MVILHSRLSDFYCQFREFKLSRISEFSGNLPSCFFENMFSSLTTTSKTPLSEAISLLLTSNFASISAAKLVA